MAIEATQDKNFTPSDYTRVCSVHFQEGINFSVTIYYDVGEPSSLEDECYPDWAPTLRLGGALWYLQELSGTV